MTDDNVNEGAVPTPEDLRKPKEVEAPKKRELVVEGMEDASLAEFKAEAEKLEAEVSELEAGVLKEKKARARLIRRKMSIMAPECECKTFTRVGEAGNGRVLRLECDECKIQYAARGER